MKRNSVACILNRSNTYLAAYKIRKQNIFRYEEYLNGNILKMNEYEPKVEHLRCRICRKRQD